MKAYSCMAAVCAAAVLMTSCKSSEKAYQNAYKKMVADETSSATQKAVVVTNSDADGIRSERVKVIQGSGIKFYSIVCGSYSLKANADYMYDALKSSGYEPMIVQTLDNTKMYRVVAQTFDNKAKAFEARAAIQKKYKDAWILYKRP